MSDRSLFTRLGPTVPHPSPHEADPGRTGVAPGRHPRPAATAALPEMVKCLKDKVPETRVAAAEAVCRIGADAKPREKAEAVLVAELSHADTAVAILAVRACGAAQARAAVPQLKKLADSGTAAFKAEAAAVLKALEK